MARRILIPLLFVTFLSTGAFAQEAGKTEQEAVKAEEAPPQESPPPVLYEGVVTRVRDVDLIEIDGEKMRLLGVSGPRRWWWNEPRDCYSMESAIFLEGLVLDKTVGYAYDRAAGPHRRWGVRRIYVFLDGEFINEELIANGQAFAERRDDYAQREHFLELESLARLRQTGLWHTCPVECHRREACRTKGW